MSPKQEPISNAAHKDLKDVLDKHDLLNAQPQNTCPAGQHLALIAEKDPSGNIVFRYECVPD